MTYPLDQWKQKLEEMLDEFSILKGVNVESVRSNDKAGRNIIIWFDEKTGRKVTEIHLSDHEYSEQEKNEFEESLSAFCEEYNQKRGLSTA